MKKLSTLFFLLAGLLWLGCEEIPPVINPSMGGSNPDGPTPVEDQQRQVLIEEFTGVRCVNCPAGSAAIEGLLGLHGQQLVAISIHAGSFAPPYSESQYDFRIDEGASLLSYLGEPLGYPTAVVNRKKFDGEFDLQLGRQQWAGFIAQELLEPPKVKIDIENAYNNEDRKLEVKATLYVEETISEEDIRISVAITESDVEDLQLTPESGTPDPNYKHQHVLRGMLTNYDGNPIDEPLGAGAIIEKTFSTTLPTDWVASNCDVVVFVNLNGEKKDVLQVHHAAVTE
ncbi:MAG: Omp28-related outer membrane protein [Phaeodactylibacter sp.]|nr:Omp28-related outer membrane protein [Phaeodactylibacter sp.]MCB9267559.1 Omp28-related outer membrane protein [Lewinellaceae bacterium]MCB9288959.1 Omp28-related outer membrane protein [Lewinellaceae bacterium]